MARACKPEWVDPGEVWLNEAKGFMPWFGDNIDVLCEVPRSSFEITTLEGEAGDFYIDLVGRDVPGTRVVPRQKAGV